MRCKYAYTNKKEPRAKIYCQLTNMPCVYSRFCVNMNKYVPKEKEMENCTLIMENKRDKIPNGAYYVRFIKRGFLYIEYKDSIIKVKNTFDSDDITYVYIDIVDGEYVTSLTPFETEKKKVYKRKKKENVEEEG